MNIEKKISINVYTKKFITKKNIIKQNKKLLNYILFINFSFF